MRCFSQQTECLTEIQRLKLLQKQYPLQPEIIPPELARSSQWVVWAYEIRATKNSTFRIVKTPYQPRNPKRKASTIFRLNWSDLEAALQCVKHNPNFDGIGYVFLKGDGLTGVDFDNCRNPKTRKIREEYQFWIDKLGGYTEISPSGTGVKVWVKGTVVDKYFKTVESAGFRILNFAGGEIEVYRQGQYFTVTTQCLKGFEFIKSAQSELDVLSEISLSRTGSGYEYLVNPDIQPTESDVHRELPLLQKYWDEIGDGYIDESNLQVGPITQSTTGQLTDSEPQFIRHYNDLLLSCSWFMIK